MSLKTSLLSFMRTIDLNGNGISLRHNSHKQIKTVIGGLITIIITIFSLYCIVYFSQDIINKEKPISLFNKDFTPNSQVFIKDFPFAMSFATSGGVLKTDFQRNIGVDVLYYEMYFNIPIRISKLTVEPCDPSRHFGKHFNVLNGTFPMDVSYCLNQERIQYSKAHGR
jgi:hypothetical protein